MQIKRFTIPRLRITSALLVLAICSVITSTYFGSFGRARLTHIQEQVMLLQHERSRLQTLVERLRGEVDSLEHEEAALERYAREELALAKKNERVYILVPPEQEGT